MSLLVSEDMGSFRKDSNAHKDKEEAGKKNEEGTEFTNYLHPS